MPGDTSSPTGPASLRRTPRGWWRRSAAALAVGALAASGLVAAAAPAHAIDTGATYVLKNRHSGLVADVAARSTADGAAVNQYTPTGGTNQQWRFVPAGSGYYRIVAVHSGKAIDLWEWSSADGAEIRQFEDLGGANQQWRPVDTAGGVQLVNRHSGKSLEVWAWSTSAGDRLSQYTSHGGANQVWDLEVVGGGSSGQCGSGSPHVEVTQSGSTWTTRRGGTTLYSGGVMLTAIRAGIDGLTPGRTTQERVVVRGSGSMPASTSIDLPSHTSLEVCGTIDVTGSATADNAAVRIRHARDVSVPHLSLTGAPYFGIWVRTSSDVHLGRIDLRMSGGHGLRVDSRDNDAVREARNIRIDDVHVSGTGSHGVETYGVDGLTIGTVTARNTGYSGLLLNDTVNATVGRVDGQGAGTGTGYAAFRMANRNGAVGSSYPTNIRVGEVVARGGGRGIFCVSQSGGVDIQRVDIANTGGDAILIENCYNVTIASQGGTVSGPGGIRIAARTEFPNTRDVTFANLSLTNLTLRESPCAVNTQLRNITWNNASNQTC